MKKETIKIPVRTRSTSFCDPIQFKILQDTEINLTRKRAFDFLEAEPFEGERLVREGHVQHLYDEVCAGRFVWHHVMLALAMLKGRTYRINGQHTCWMRVNIPESQDPGKCMVRQIVYEVPDEDGLRGLYSTFDRNAPRTAQHIGRVMIMGHECGANLPPTYIGGLIAGFRVFWCGNANNAHLRGRMSVDEIVGLIGKNYGQLFGAVGLFYQAHAREAAWVRRAAVLGAMFATFEKSVELSNEFWTPVVSGIGLPEKNDPRYQLRRWIETHTQSSGNALGVKTSTEENYRVCVNCWNKWRSGDTMDIVRTPDSRPKAKA